MSVVRSARPSSRLEIPKRGDHLGGGERAPSVVVRQRVVWVSRCRRKSSCVPFRATTEYRYAVVNDRRVIVEPRTRGSSRSSTDRG